MKKILVTTSFIAAMVASSGASAATTLSISSCDANGVTYTYSTTHTSAEVIASNAAGEESFLEFSATSGTLTSDFASAWSDASNAALTLQLYGITGETFETATATCP